MTVNELRDALKGVDGSIEVILNCDSYDWVVVRAEIGNDRCVADDGSTFSETFFYLTGRG